MTPCLSPYLSLLQLEVAAVARAEPSPELEKKIKLMAMDRLQMERVMAKLYSVRACGWARKWVWLGLT